jgi:hypothetical protein
MDGKRALKKAAAQLNEGVQKRLKSIKRPEQRDRPPHLPKLKRRGL